MYKQKRILAIIPARGGSKGLPGKNIRRLHGKPLITWTIEQAQACSSVDQVLVSTDSAVIAEVATASQATIHQRPANLATDSALVVDTLKHALEEPAIVQQGFDVAVLLQATSPIRPENLIDECVAQLINATADSIATFSELAESPMRLWTINGGEAETLFSDANPWLPRQQLPTAYHLNGLLYAFNIQKFLAQPPNRSVFFGRKVAKITPAAVDIDTLADFEEASRLIQLDP